MKRPLRVAALLFSLPIGALASGSYAASSELLNKAHDCPRELVNSIDSLNWIARLSLLANQLPYTLGPDYAQILVNLDNHKAKKDAKECITKTANGLFNRIMKSESKADKIKALQALDPFLNNATAAYLIDSILKSVERSSTLSKKPSIKENKKKINKEIKKKVKKQIKKKYKKKSKSKTNKTPKKKIKKKLEKEAKKRVKKELEKKAKEAKKENEKKTRKETKKANRIHLNFETLSSAIKSLSIKKVKPIYKDYANAESLLKLKYKYKSTDMPAIDSSIWFLLTQLQFYKSSLKEFMRMGINIAYIIKYKIILRTDVNIKHVYEDMKNAEWEDWIFWWYSYIVEKSLLRNTKSNGIQADWELIGKSLSLKDPRLAAKTLDANLPFKYRGARSYLLLLLDDPTRRLARLESKSIDEMYSCFIFASNASSYLDRYNFHFFLAQVGNVRGMPKEKLAEVTEHLAELEKLDENDCSLSYMQTMLPYLSLVSLLDLVQLFKNKDDYNDHPFNEHYARILARVPKTLELLDVSRGLNISTGLIHVKAFNRYLLENPNLNESFGEHFHYSISLLMMSNCERMTENFNEYIGTDIHTFLSKPKNWRSTRVDCTLDSAPRRLNSYLEIIDEQTKERRIRPSKRLNIAFLGSLFNDKDPKKDFVHYQVRKLFPPKNLLEENPLNRLRIIRIVLPNSKPAPMHYKYKNYKSKKIEPFLHFEDLVYRYFSGLTQMDVEKSLQRLYAKNSFSIELRKFIKKNFTSGMLPFALKKLQLLESEVFKYNPEMAMKLQIGKIPIMTVLKAIYMALADPSELKLAFVRHLYNAKFLHSSLT